MTSISPLVERYKRYRGAGQKLNHKIIDAMMTEAVLATAADQLGVRESKKRLVLRDADEGDVLMDFALYEVPVEGKNLVTRYAEKVGGKSRTERDLLIAMGVARTSLFQVTTVRPLTCQLELEELIEPKRTLKLIDISLSQSVDQGYIFFFRLLELTEFAMTSGIGLPFPPKMEDELIQEWENRNAAERFVKCFELSKRSGISMGYLQV